MEINLADLQSLEVGTPEFFAAQEELRSIGSTLSEVRIPRNMLQSFTITLSSKLSVARFQKARLFQYFVFCDSNGELGEVDLFAIDLGDATRRWNLLQEWAACLLYQADPISTGDLDAVPGDSDESEPDDILDESEWLAEVEARLRSEFIGLTLGQLGNLCRAAACYTRAEALLAEMKTQATTSLAQVAAFLNLVHGPGYAVPSALTGQLDLYRLGPGRLETEAVHHMLSNELVSTLSMLQMSITVHPMLFVTIMSHASTLWQRLGEELSQTKHVWQVSKGHDRRRISRKLDAQLHVIFLRMRTEAPANARVNWQGIADMARLDEVTQSESPEQYARKLWSSRTELPWIDLFMSERCTDRAGALELAGMGLDQYLVHSKKIRQLRDEEV